MSILQSAMLYSGQVLLVAVLLTVMLGRYIKADRPRVFAVAILLVLGVFLPVNGLSFAQWLRSVIGDLSLLTLLVFFNILAQRLFHYTLVEPATRKALLVGIALLGAVFYPLSLGLSSIDPYQLGYAPLLMSGLLFLLSVTAWLGAKRGLAAVLLLPLIAYNLSLLESTNLWDYLLDPILFIYALVQVWVGREFLRSKRAVVSL
jgi:hypothetical protein